MFVRRVVVAEEVVVVVVVEVVVVVVVVVEVVVVGVVVVVVVVVVALCRAVLVQQDVRRLDVPVEDLGPVAMMIHTLRTLTVIGWSFIDINLF